MSRLAAAELSSSRLLLRSPAPAMVSAVVDYQRRNRAHFAPWDPPLPADHFEPESVASRLQAGAQAFADAQAYRYWFSLRDDPERLIGQVHVSQLARGAFQSAMLGYTLDQQAQGRGLMHEALHTVLDEMFGSRVRLHRLQAAVRPENHRSLAVLQRLGFVPEGLSRRYLFIDGAWRDHAVYARLNPDWAHDAPP